MRNLTRTWRTWKHGRKFAKIGKGCRFPGKYLTVEGHVELGDYCRFRDNVIMRADKGAKITFGTRSGVSNFCVIEATKLIQIGDATAMAEFCVLRDANHMVYGSDLHWRITPLLAEPIVIGNNCFIGSRCYIMPGVTIGDGAVIQAGSIVTKNVGSYEVWAGMPARRVSHRFKNIPEQRQKEYEEMIAKYGVKKDRYVSDELNEKGRMPDSLDNDAQ